MIMEILFWAVLGLLFYTYIGYGLTIGLLVKVKSWLAASKESTPGLISDDEAPNCTLLIAAWNEIDILPAKAADIAQLTYPHGKLEVVFVTDGSDDGSEEWLRENTDFTVHHRPERKGKTAALNRVLPMIDSDVVVFTDANTMLHPQALERLVAPYADPTVGAVSGEKRVGVVDTDKAHGAGEGLYWRYESLLKRLDYQLHTVVGAAGELFSVRTRLYQAVPEDTILDDFMITLGIVERGFRVAYVPDAYALEAPSASLSDEMKRKNRICAGGFQSMVRLPGMLNMVRRPVAVFQYVSHRLLRWAVAPFLLPVLFLTNLWLAPESWMYAIILIAHVMFYVLAGAGWWMRNRSMQSGWVFTPLYFLMMNVSAWIGLWRFLRGKQSAAWIRARRAG